MGMSGQRHAPAALYPFRYPLDKRMGGPQSRSGHTIIIIIITIIIIIILLLSHEL
jgi:hypothetical protein